MENIKYTKLQSKKERTYGLSDPDYYNEKYIIISNHKGNNLHVGLYNSPTYNCQLFSIAAAQSLISLNGDYFGMKEKKYTIIKEVLHFGKRKKIMLLDVKINVVVPLLDLFKPFTNLIMRNNYTSSNDSKMCILLLQIDYNELDKLVRNENK